MVIQNYRTPAGFFLMVWIMAICLQCTPAGALVAVAPGAGAPQNPVDLTAESPVPGTTGFFVPLTGPDAPGSGFRYQSEGTDYFLMPDDLVIALPDDFPPGTPPDPPVRIRYEGQEQARLTGELRRSGTAQFFIGNDPSRWREDVPLFGEVRYREISAGIDLIYRDAGGHLKSTFIVAPGADPAAIRYHVGGAERIRIDSRGALVIDTAGGWQITQEPPAAYQEIGGVVRRVPVRYYLADEQSGGFLPGSYDAAYPLVIDPEIITAGYLGGDVEDAAHGIAVDPLGNLYIIGYTHSTDFPATRTAFNATASGYYDIFVTAYTANGTEVLYSTYLGGAGNDNGRAIAVGPDGTAYITGSTECPDFPVKNAFQPYLAGSYDAFVAALTPGGGSLAFSSYLGGTGMDDANGIAFSPRTTTLQLTGSTRSPDFPVKHAVQERSGGKLDAFITVIDGSGQALVTSTYLGGREDDYGCGIAADPAGSIYVTGYTYSSKSSDFPTKIPLMGPHVITYDAFVSKYTPDAGGLVYSTYLGGTLGDRALAIAVDPRGTAYVTGFTHSSDYPVTPGAFQGGYGGEPYADAFITGLAPDGQSLVGSTYLGGSGDDLGYGITFTPGGQVYVTGGTMSPDFPLRDAWKTSLSGQMDAFVTGMDASCSRPVLSSYLGGNGSDRGNAITSDSRGFLAVAGTTGSDPFPVVNATQARYGGDDDAFLAVIRPDEAAGTPSQPAGQPGPLSLAAVLAALCGGCTLAWARKKNAR